MLENTEQWNFTSTANGSVYEIKVSYPIGPKPEEGYQVYYILDGDAYFHLAREVVRLQSKNTLKTSISKAIVVGICHQGSAKEVGEKRFYDFTPPAKEYTYPDRLKGKNLGPHGGASRFLSFLTEELMPKIQSTYHINLHKQTLFGHSLSGLFTIWAMFIRPMLFTHYLAISPSIWWNNKELVQYAERFTPSDDNLFMAVGSEEYYIVDDAKEMQKLLENKVKLQFHIAPEENHASVVPTTISRAFRYAASV